MAYTQSRSIRISEKQRELKRCCAPAGKQAIAVHINNMATIELIEQLLSLFINIVTDYK